MTTKYGPRVTNNKLVSGPYGNAFSEVFPSGALSSTLPATTELIHFGELPSGTQVNDMQYIFDDFGTSVTHDVGFALVGTPPSGTVIAKLSDGTTLTAGDDDYWFNDKDVATAAGRSQSTALPITFLWPVEIIVTQTGTITGTPDCAVYLSGQTNGPK